MNLEELKTRVARQAPAAERRPDCPDDYVIASFVDGGLDAQEHAQLELHIADCEYCLALVGLLGRAIDSEPGTAVPELLLARSARLAGAGKSTAGARAALYLQTHQRWATAAILVLACGLYFAFESSERGGMPSASTVESPVTVRQERNLDPAAMAPELSFPAEGSNIDPQTQAFAWSPVKGSLFYQVRIVNDEGDLLWQERTTGTQWKLPAQVSLDGGSEYFVRIDAYLSQSRSLNSDYVAFKVRRPD